MLRALSLSVGLFTAIPVPRPGNGQPSRRTVRWAILLSPLVGAGLGAVVALVVWIARDVLEEHLLSPPALALGILLSAAFGIAALQILSGGIHLDGLADSADGWAARAGRTRTLAVMRDSATGPLGALTVTFVVLFDVAALAVSVLNGHGTTAAITAVVAGKVAVVWGCVWPAARPEGLGNWVAGCTTWRSALVVTVLAAAVPVLLLTRDDEPFGPGLPYALAAIPVGVLLAIVATTPLRRRVGGITGDILGACAELATTTTLVMMVLTAY